MPERKPQGLGEGYWRVPQEISVTSPSRAVGEEGSHGHPCLPTLAGLGTPARGLGLHRPVGRSRPGVIYCL